MARTSLITNADLISVKRLRSCEARTPAGMMRAAGKILDGETPQLISSNEEKAPRYVDERCKTIDPNFRRAPFNRVRSPREAQKRRAKAWVDCQFALPRLTLEGLRTIAITLAQEQQHSEWPGERARYPKTLNYYVTAALNDFFQKMGYPEFCVGEQESISNHVRRFRAPDI